jgi:hypothetical protein
MLVEVQLSTKANNQQKAISSEQNLPKDSPESQEQNPTTPGPQEQGGAAQPDV